MGGLIGALIQKLVEALFGKAIETVGEQAFNRRFRRVIWALALVLSAWIAVSNALLWQTDRLPGVSGLLDYFQHGGPTWELAAVIAPVVTALWLLVPVKGRDAITFYLIAATFGLTIGALVEFQGGARYETSVLTILTLLASIVLAICAAVLARTDVPPLDAPLARFCFQYWGRYKHLLALREYGRQRGWTISGPAGKRPPLTLVGKYDPQHPVTITSSAKFSLIENTVSYTLSARMGSPDHIPDCRISYQPTPKKLQGTVVHGKTRGAPGQRRQSIYFHVAINPKHPAAESLIPRMAALAEAARPFLKLHFSNVKLKDSIVAARSSVQYTHLAAFHLTRRDAEMDPLLECMRELIDVLASISRPPTRAGVAPSLADAARSSTDLLPR
jgi:hypothetical protein